MPLVCSRCRRVNPSGASYCYFDGVHLGQGVTAAPPAPALAPFVFASGRTCRSIDELAVACLEEWEAAREALHGGVLGKYLEGIGRHDLAAAAQEARSEPDEDMALLSFTGSLPAVQAKDRPRLGLEPRRITANIKCGDQRQVKILVVNAGKGTLQGRARVSEGGQWLKLLDNNGADVLFRVQRNQELTLQVDTNGLIAGQTFSGKVTVVGNGGIAELPVKLNVVAQPFPSKPFVGANSQRKLAELMRSSPKQAVPMLESGEVRRWFAANGWTYPVPGDTARGVGAVQQFFECLGLSKPPPLALSEGQLTYACANPGVFPGEVTLRQVLPVKVTCPKCRTPNEAGKPQCQSCGGRLPDPRKWVYAQIESDAPWLRVLTPSVTGPLQAAIRFEVDADQLAESRLYKANLQVRANAGQRLTLPVLADARRPQESPLLVLLRPVLVGALLAVVLRLALAVPADLLARWLIPAAVESSRRRAEDASPDRTSTRHALIVWLVPESAGRQPSDNRPAAGSLPRWKQTPGTDDGFLKLFVLATWWVGGVVGWRLVRRRESSAADLVSGVVAGAAAGLAVAATFGCAMIVVDAVPRALLRGLGDVNPPAAVATGLWVFLAVLWWALLGGGLGLLFGALGRRGIALMATLTAPLSDLCRTFGLRSAAAFFTFRSV